MRLKTSDNAHPGFPETMLSIRNFNKTAPDFKEMVFVYGSTGIVAMVDLNMQLTMACAVYYKAAPWPALAPTTFWTRAASRPPPRSRSFATAAASDLYRTANVNDRLHGGSTDHAGPEGGRSQGRRWRSFGVKPSRQNWCSWRSSRKWYLEGCEE